MNVADQASRRGGVLWYIWPELDDGHTLHAAVGTFVANRFGLHDVHGNLTEWCRDWFGSYTLPVRPRDGEREVTDSGAHERTNRGGSFANATRYTRSAYRSHHSPWLRYEDFGVRPARVIER